MATVPALIAVDRAAVDARPLVKSGLLDFAKLCSPDDATSYATRKDIFDWLGDERVYASIVRRLCHHADLAAAHLAADLGEDPAVVREAFDVAMRAWHLALWQLADEEIVLAEHEAASAILAPVDPRV